MKKVRDFLSRLGLYGFLFLLILFSFGIGSGYKALKYWINDEAVVNEWTVELGSKGETDYVSNFWGKVGFLNLNGFMRNLTAQREMNGVVKMDNGYLYLPYDSMSDEDMEQRVESLANLNRFLSASDREFLFAITPDTVSKYDSQIPFGNTYTVNDDMDRLIPMLEEQGIEVMDIREEIHEDGIDQYDLMFKTDHHWTPRAGFYVYGKLADWIEENTGVEVDEKIRDFENYSVTTYENWHLGSRGQRTGALFAGMDDFDLILPEFETKVTNGDSTGTYEEMFINYEPFEEKDSTFRYTYDMALRQSCGDYTNLLADNDLTVVLIGDSFSEAVCSYLNISYKEVHYIYCQQSSALTDGYLKDFEPDVVICLYCPDNIFREDSVMFGIPDV